MLVTDFVIIMKALAKVFGGDMKPGIMANEKVVWVWVNQGYSAKESYAKTQEVFDLLPERLRPLLRLQVC